ncbi:HNH endonuclease [Rhodococcus zopfii]|uniref:HNH endonuclease n=1 Tax=Rhodococcus zopfii TaxID=43772 RepID=UPI0011113DEE|nr:HNH endonuclease signature motif containing protein [Rhodococcus zopfii]
MQQDRSVTLRRRHRAYFRRHKPPCHLCGKEIDYTLHYRNPMAFVVDHVVAIARGGSDDINNKAAAHRVCNESKGAKGVDEWRAGSKPRTEPRHYVTWRTW